MSETVEFSLGAILSVMHHRQLSYPNPSEIYALIVHLAIDTDQSAVVTIDDQLLALCADELAGQLPHLVGLCTDRCGLWGRTSARDWAWLDAQERRWGLKHPVAPMANRLSP